MSNLRLINDTTITSGTTTVNITDVFSSDYDIYQVTLEGFYASGIDYFYLKLINSNGSVISATDYDLASLEMKSNTTYVERRATNYSAMVPSTNFLPDSEAESYNGVFYFFNPVSASSYSFMIGQSSQIEYGNNYNNKYIGVLEQTASMTGFQWSVGTLSKTFQGGKIRTYGLRVDS
jgi:hypothetical protein